ncbi:hypothetical protein AVDCRST_MAG82-2629, partial [uncultured Rubrobacteraceae bacterium]
GDKRTKNKPRWIGRRSSHADAVGRVGHAQGGRRANRRRLLPVRGRGGFQRRSAAPRAAPRGRVLLRSGGPLRVPHRGREDRSRPRLDGLRAEGRTARLQEHGRYRRQAAGHPDAGRDIRTPPARSGRTGGRRNTGRDRVHSDSGGLWHGGGATGCL